MAAFTVEITLIADTLEDAVERVHDMLQEDKRTTGVPKYILEAIRLKGMMPAGK